MDFEGHTIDTLNFITASGHPSQCCSPDGKYWAVPVGATQKFIYNLETENLNIINHNNAGNGFMSFSPDGTKLIWTYEGSIYITDLNSAQTYLVIQGCESKTYSYASISGDGQKIIALRTDVIDLTSNKLYIEANIIIMNIDGSNEQIITLPQ